MIEPDPEDERRREASTLLARLWNQLGRIKDFDVETAEQEGDRERGVMRCVIKLRGDQFAPRWVGMVEQTIAPSGGHLTSWLLCSRNSAGEITDEWARVFQTRPEQWAWRALQAGEPHEVPGNALDAMIACLKDMTGAD